MQPRNLGGELSGLNHSPASKNDGAFASETIRGLGGLLHAAKILGPAQSEDPNHPPTSDFGVADSALLVMSGLTDERSTRSSYDSESSEKHEFGEPAVGGLWNIWPRLVGCAGESVDRSSMHPQSVQYLSGLCILRYGSVFARIPRK